MHRRQILRFRRELVIVHRNQMNVVFWHRKLPQHLDRLVFFQQWRIHIVRVNMDHIREDRGHSER